MVIRSEVLYLRRSLEFEVIKDYKIALATLEELIKSQQEVCDHELAKNPDKSDLAHYIYFKGQAMERLQYSKDDILSNLEEAIAVEESIQEQEKNETE